MIQSGLPPWPLIEGSTVAAAGHALAELRELRDAPAAALWAAATPHAALALVAISAGTDDPDGADVPVTFADVEAVAAWCDQHDWEGAAVDAFEWAPGVEWLSFAAVARPRPGKGSAQIRDGLAHDVTRLVRLVALESALDQERSMLAAVLENASDAIVAVDRDRRVVHHNPAAVALLGRGDEKPGGPSCEEYLGCGGGLPTDAGVATALPGSTCSGRDCPFSQVMGGVAPIVVLDETAIGPPNARVPVSATYVRISGRDVGGVAVFRDLRAGHAIDELKSSFVASISHELRTPLALISGYSQSLLELDLDDVARRRFIERIDGTANRMRGLVDQLLDVATLESDRLAVDPRRIPLQPLLKSIIDDVAEVPDSLAVSLSVPPDLPPVYADPARFGQVVANLLDNARKYGTPGSMVTVRVTRADNQAVVTVDNDGPEIASEEREAVFERFYRGRDARSSGTPGAGLGLYLSRRLVEAHGGRTRLEERRGGTCVSLTLPLALEGWTQNDGEEAAIDRPAFGTLNERSTAPEIDQRGGP